jgi:hypothetical protein
LRSIQSIAVIFSSCKEIIQKFQFVNCITTGMKLKILTMLLCIRRTPEILQSLQK